MTEFFTSLSPQKNARIAGLLYLVNIVTGIFVLMYIPGKLIVWSNAATTFKNITESETLFRVGILVYFVCYIFFLLLPLALYKLLKEVNKNYAILMVILALVQIPMAFVNILNYFAVLTLIGKASYLHTFDLSHLQAQVMLNLHFYSQGNQVASIFWGLWLLPFGYLVYKSGFLPKILGIFLIVGGLSYLIDFTCDFLFTGYGKMTISSFVTIPASIGEIGICLWLLIMGVKKQKAT